MGFACGATDLHWLTSKLPDILVACKKHCMILPERWSCHVKVLFWRVFWFFFREPRHPKTNPRVLLKTRFIHLSKTLQLSPAPSSDSSNISERQGREREKMHFLFHSPWSCCLGSTSTILKPLENIPGQKVWRQYLLPQTLLQEHLLCKQTLDTGKKSYLGEETKIRLKMYNHTLTGWKINTVSF